MSVYLASCMYVCMGSYSWVNGVCLIDFREYVYIFYLVFTTLHVFLVVLSHLCM